MVRSRARASPWHLQPPCFRSGVALFILIFWVNNSSANICRLSLSRQHSPGLGPLPACPSPSLSPSLESGIRPCTCREIHTPAPALSTDVALVALINGGAPQHDGYGGNKGNVGNWGARAKSLSSLLCKR